MRVHLTKQACIGWRIGHAANCMLLCFSTLPFTALRQWRIFGSGGLRWRAVERSEWRIWSWRLEIGQIYATTHMHLKCSTTVIRKRDKAISIHRSICFLFRARSFGSPIHLNARRAIASNDKSRIIVRRPDMSVSQMRNTSPQQKHSVDHLLYTNVNVIVSLLRFRAKKRVIYIHSGYGPVPRMLWYYIVE